MVGNVHKNELKGTKICYFPMACCYTKFMKSRQLGIYNINVWILTWKWMEHMSPGNLKTVKINKNLVTFLES
jgi:hypothetical protein